MLRQSSSFASRATSWLAMLAAVSALACRRAPDTRDAATRAKETFENRCATCHGSGGRGDGPAARGLQAAPRDSTDATWQRTVTDAQIKDAIVKGGAATGKSAAMPANADLDPVVVDALVAIVRGFAR